MRRFTRGRMLLDVFVVQAQDGRAVERNFARRMSANASRISSMIRVVIQMLAVDVGHHRQNRRQLQKRSVAFVAFDHQVIALAQRARSSRASRRRVRRPRRWDPDPRGSESPRPSRSSWSCRGCRRRRCRTSGASARPAARRAGSREARGAALRPFPDCPARTAELTTTALAPPTIRGRVAFVNDRAARRQTLGDRREVSESEPVTG